MFAALPYCNAKKRIKRAAMGIAGSTLPWQASAMQGEGVDWQLLHISQIHASCTDPLARPCARKPANTQPAPHPILVLSPMSTTAPSSHAEIAARAHAALAMHDTPVPSPCVTRCQIDPANGYCRGCWRSLQEIIAWQSLDDTGKRHIWRETVNRSALPPAHTQRHR